MTTFKDAVLGVNGISDKFLVVGNCDLIIQGLTSGMIKLQYKLTPSAALPAPVWTDFPEAAFTENIYKTIFISEHGTVCRLVGVSNNAGAYVRISRFLND